MRYFSIWLVINFVTAYDLTCPHPGQWELRARAKNCSSIQNYVCLFDNVQLTFEDNCKGPLKERKGNQIVMNNGYFNRKSCSPTHYQPFTLSSFGNTNCTYLKSPCSEEGQVIAYNGTSVSDRRCRCDYRRGYAFSAINHQPCFCRPSEEECTCFQKPCRENEVLSPDYRCVKEIEQPGNYTCSQLLDKNSIESGTAVVNPMHDSSNRSYYDKVNRYRLRGVCFFVIGILLVLCLILIYWNILKNRFTEYSQKDYFVEPLEELVKCLEGETVTLQCKVNKERTTGIWFKDGEKLNVSVTNGKIHELEIVNVTIEDRGYYTLFIKNIACSSLLLVLGDRQERMNYLRLIYLLETVAQPVVRKIFDREFHPLRLRQTLNKSTKLHFLRKRKHLNKAEYDMLFPAKVDTIAPISSEDFDIRLMIVLLRNLAEFDISDIFPLKDDTSEGADLSRIKFIRNKLVHNNDSKTSDDEFEENWKQLTEAVVRLDGTCESSCQTLKKLIITPDQCQKNLTSKSMKSDSESVVSLTNWKDRISKQAIQKVARDTVQKIFDEQFPVKILRKAINERFEYLSSLKEQKEITQSEWEHLHPAEHENISSQTFDTKLMMMLLKDSQLKETPKLKAIENLNNLLSKTNPDYWAIKQALTEVSEEEVDFK